MPTLGRGQADPVPVGRVMRGSLLSPLEAVVAFVSIALALFVLLEACQ